MKLWFTRQVCTISISRAAIWNFHSRRHYFLLPRARFHCLSCFREAPIFVVIILCCLWGFVLWRLLPGTFIPAAPIHSLTFYPASHAINMQQKVFKFLACELHFEIFISVYIMKSHRIYVSVTNVLPYVYMKISCVCCGKEMLDCDVWYSLEHFTSGVYAKMTRCLNMFL